MESILMRVSVDFKKWCDKMKEEKQAITTNKNELLSGKRITELIPKHTLSQNIKEDILNYSWSGKWLRERAE